MKSKAKVTGLIRLVDVSEDIDEGDWFNHGKTSLVPEEI